MRQKRNRGISTPHHTDVWASVSTCQREDIRSCRAGGRTITSLICIFKCQSRDEAEGLFTWWQSKRPNQLLNFAVLLTFQHAFPLSHLTPLHHPQQRCKKSHLFFFSSFAPIKTVAYKKQYSTQRNTIVIIIIIIIIHSWQQRLIIYYSWPATNFLNTAFTFLQFSTSKLFTLTHSCSHH